MKINNLKIHNKKITFLRFLSDDNVISYSLDNTLKLHNCLSGKMLNCFAPNILTAIELLVNEFSILIAIKGDNEVQMRDLNTFEKKMFFRLEKKELCIMKTTKHSKYLIGCSIDGEILIWSFLTTHLITIIETNYKILCLEVLSDEFTIITSHLDKRIRLWNWETGEEVGFTENIYEPIKAMVMTPDNAILISTGGPSFSLKKSMINKIKTKFIIDHHSKEINIVITSPENKYIALGSSDNTISIWELKTVKLFCILKGHVLPVTTLLFINDSKNLISGSNDYTIRVWNIEKKEQIKILKELCGKITCIKSYDNQSKILVSTDDSCVSAIEVENLKRLGYFSQQASIYTVEVSKDESKCFVGGHEKSIEMIGLENHNLMKSILKQSNAHICSIICLTVFPNGNKLLSGGDDAIIKIWNIQDNKIDFIQQLIYHKKSISSLIFSSNGSRFFSASADKYIFVWDSEDFKKISEFEGHTNAITSLCLTTDDKTLFSSSRDNTVRAWKNEDSHQLQFLNGHCSKIMQLAITSDGNYLASGSYSTEIILWDLKKDKQNCFVTSQLEMGKICNLFFTKDDSKLIAATTTNGSCILIWDVKKEEQLEIVEFLTSYPNQIILTTDEKNFYIAFADSTIRIWNFEDKSMTKTPFLDHCGGVVCLALTKNDKILVSAGIDQLIFIWDLQSNKKIKYLQGHQDKIKFLKLNFEETLLFSGGNEKKIYIWDFIKFTQFKVIEGFDNFISDIYINLEDDKFCVICDTRKEKQKNKNLLIYSSKTYERLPYFNEKTLGLSSLTVSKDKKTIIVAGEDKIIRFYDCKNYKSIKNYSGYSNLLNSLAISQDKKIFALGDGDHKILVWNLENNNQLAFLEGHTKRINYLLITSKGIIISASSDKTIGLWSIALRERIKILQGHNDAIWSLALTPNENRILSSSKDLTIILWDLATGGQLKKFLTGSDEIFDLCIYDSKTFISGGSDRTLKLWDLEDNDNQTPKNLAFLNAQIKRITLSPNLKILIVLLDSLEMKVFDTRNYSLMITTSCPNLLNLPNFISNQDNRLIIFYDKIIDCYTGHVIFKFQVSTVILAYFYDIKFRKYFMLSNNFELFQYNHDIFADHLYNFISYDSLITMAKDSDLICSQKMSSFPYIF